MSEMNSTANAVNSAEYEIIGKAILSLIEQCSELPSGVKFDYQAVNGNNHIGFLTAPGSMYTFEGIYGDFEAQLPFQILYKVSATDSVHMLNAETLLDSIANQLPNMIYPALTDNRVIKRIRFDSITYRSTADQDGSVVFIRNGTVKYEKNI